MAIEKFQYKEKLTSEKLNKIVAAVNDMSGDSEEHTKEKVIVHLETNSGHVNFHGLPLVITENTNGGKIHNLELDEIGMAIAYVAVGISYTITFPSIEGYSAQEPLTFTSEHYEREVSVIYKKIYNDLRDVARSFVVEQSSSPMCALSEREDVIDRILSHGSFVIDETYKKYARLSDTDSNVFEDGTPWNGAYGNAFRYLPSIYILHDKEHADGGQKYWVSDEPLDGAMQLPESWIGMYKGSYTDNVLRSIPNVMSQETQTMSQFWAAAQKVGGGYGLVNYFDHQKLNALHLAKYGNMNSDVTVGVGLRDAGSGYYNHKTGTTAALGNRTGTAPYLNTTFRMVRLFGIEDLFGTTWEFRPNIRFDNGNAIVYEGNIVSNVATPIRQFARLQTASHQYVKNMALGDNFDLIAVDANGASDSTYWCDGTWAQPTGQLLLVGGASISGSFCGLSCTDAIDGFSVSSATVGARLAFKGDISDYELVSGADLAALHS